MRLADLAVVYTEAGSFAASAALAAKLAVPLLDVQTLDKTTAQGFYLAYREGCLKLLDSQSLKKGGLAVEIDPRPGEQHSYPAPKNNGLALALGKKTQTVVDATTGWAQDSLAIFRMGYQVQCIERSLIMAELIQDGFNRLTAKPWVQSRGLTAPILHTGDAINLLGQLPETPDCIYLDPMFPPKPKKSALAKKAMMVLRDILGDDLDRAALFEAAWQATGRRVVVKSPDYAPPLAGKPAETHQGKLLRYDVYIK